MPVLSVVGTQWGDEGKGKLTDVLAQQADIVVRYQGGNNAGHSIVIEGVRHALNLLPSGVFNQNAINVLANGMVINLQALKKEMETLQDSGFDFQIKISDRAHVVFPYHSELDGLLEEKKEARKIGTTKKGIGPAYTDKASREGIRIIDLYDDELFFELLKWNVKMKNLLIEHFGGKVKFDAEELYTEYKELREFFKPYITDTSVLINNAHEEGKNILFEGAQGVLLDLDHGTYPFVTSSSPTSSYAPVGAGIAPHMIDHSLGIVKAYSTRVGTGGFPTEFDDNTAESIRKDGNEFGTVTGRPRRVGWFDANLVRHAKRVSGLTSMSVMLLDVLTGKGALKIATGYKLDGEYIETIPAGEADFNAAVPTYVEVPGWEEDITSVTSFEELPENAQNYLKKIEELVGIPVSVFSVGPDREQTVHIQNLWK